MVEGRNANFGHGSGASVEAHVGDVAVSESGSTKPVSQSSAPTYEKTGLTDGRDVHFRAGALSGRTPAGHNPEVVPGTSLKQHFDSPEVDLKTGAGTFSDLARHRERRKRVEKEGRSNVLYPSSQFTDHVEGEDQKDYRKSLHSLANAASKKSNLTGVKASGTAVTTLTGDERNYVAQQADVKTRTRETLEAHKANKPGALDSSGTGTGPDGEELSSHRNPHPIDVMMTAIGNPDLSDGERHSAVKTSIQQLAQAHRQKNVDSWAQTKRKGGGGIKDGVSPEDSQTLASMHGHAHDLATHAIEQLGRTEYGGARPSGRSHVVGSLVEKTRALQNQNARKREARANDAANTAGELPNHVKQANAKAKTRNDMITAAVHGLGASGGDVHPKLKELGFDPKNQDHVSHLHDAIQSAVPTGKHFNTGVAKKRFGVGTGQRGLDHVMSLVEGKLDFSGSEARANSAASNPLKVIPSDAGAATDKRRKYDLADEKKILGGEKKDPNITLGSEVTHVMGPGGKARRVGDEDPDTRLSNANEFEVQGAPPSTKWPDAYNPRDESEEYRVQKKALSPNWPDKYPLRPDTSKDSEFRPVPQTGAPSESTPVLRSADTSSAGDEFTRRRPTGSNFTAVNLSAGDPNAASKHIEQIETSDSSNGISTRHGKNGHEG